MTPPALEVRGLGKRYRLGGFGAGSLREEIERWWRRSPENTPTVNEFWALRGLTFAVAPGEVVGVIGRNGAGKSTLLKVLSRITEPTEGEARLRGRVASLLEVGTGFHPELTGRENVFLNGAILGMGQAEVRAKFDEIVAFAEVERFIDTPVKRYSSGMYVRLAFAVAAHLEPDILIIDEVLAVGDRVFQDRCVGRMREVSRSGRTVLFVSHNMGTVSSLTQRCVYLREGRLAAVGPTPQVVAQYLGDGVQAGAVWHRPAGAPLGPVVFHRVRLLNAQGQVATEFGADEGFTIELEYEVREVRAGTVVEAYVHSADGAPVVTLGDADAEPERLRRRDPGRYRARVPVAGRTLGLGTHFIRVNSGTSHETFDLHEALRFTLQPAAEGDPRINRLGYTVPLTPWATERME